MSELKHFACNKENIKAPLNHPFLWGRLSSQRASNAKNICKSWCFFLDINDCASNPCGNGSVCVDGMNLYACSCATGYYGTQCELGRFGYPDINIIFQGRRIQNIYIYNSLFVVVTHHLSRVSLICLSSCISHYQREEISEIWRCFEISNLSETDQNVF